MTTRPPLPPGQREREDFPRFGLTHFANRFPARADRVELRILGDVRTPLTLTDELARLPRVEQRSDFHCVTTWSRCAVAWGGYRFTDFYHQLVLPLAGPATDISLVVLRGQDGARGSLPLADLLAHDVLLADRLDGQPLGMDHGAPLRLVAPAHYGYKNLKHLDSIEFLRSSAGYRPQGLRFMVHERARVAQEERGRWVPGWLLRRLYRPLIAPTVRLFAEASRNRAP